MAVRGLSGDGLFSKRRSIVPVGPLRSGACDRSQFPPAKAPQRCSRWRESAARPRARSHRTMSPVHQDNPDRYLKSRRTECFSTQPAVWSPQWLPRPLRPRKRPSARPSHRCRPKAHTAVCAAAPTRARAVREGDHRRAHPLKGRPRRCPSKATLRHAHARRHATRPRSRCPVVTRSACRARLRRRSRIPAQELFRVINRCVPLRRRLRRRLSRRAAIARERVAR